MLSRNAFHFQGFQLSKLTRKAQARIGEYVVTKRRLVSRSANDVSDKGEGAR